MKLLIVSPIFPPEIGGPATYVSGLLKNLREHHQVSVVTFAKETSSAPKNVHLVSIMGGMILRQMRLVLQLFKHAKKCDVIYAQGTIVVGVAAMIVAAWRNIPLVLKFVGDELWESKAESSVKEASLEDFYTKSHMFSCKMQLHRMVLRRAKKIIVPSEYLKEFLVASHGINYSRIVVINNAVEIHKEAFKPARKRNKHKLVFVGRLVPWKHVDEIIAAVALARQEKPWTLDIIGDGVSRALLAQQVSNLADNSWITFRGKLSKLETRAEIASAHAIILYSTYEGQPHTLIESLLLETPVIASDIKPHAELLGNSNLVPIHDSRALATAINNPLSFRRRRIHAPEFSWKSHVKNLEKTLRQLQ